MNIRAMGLMLALAAACGPQTGTKMQVETNGRLVGEMAAHHTYAYAPHAFPPDGDEQWRNTAKVVERIQADIDADMQKRGYVLAPDGELTVRISLGVRRVEDEPTGSAAVLAGAPVKTKVLGEIVIDVFDRASGGQLFHGIAKDELHSREIDAGKLSKEVRLILDPIPYSAARSAP